MGAFRYKHAAIRKRIGKLGVVLCVCFRFVTFPTPVCNIGFPFSTGVLFKRAYPNRGYDSLLRPGYATIISL